MSNYSVVHRAEPKHKCAAGAMFKRAKKEQWTKYTIVECDDCGRQYYYKPGKNYDWLHDIGWWNRGWIERKAGLR